MNVIEGEFVFQHHMTMNVCGPTSCGKTIWLKQFLLNVNRMIQPRPHYIIWFNKRMQSFFNERFPTLFYF